MAGCFRSEGRPSRNQQDRKIVTKLYAWHSYRRWAWNMPSMQSRKDTHGMWRTSRPSKDEAQCARPIGIAALASQEDPPWCHTCSCVSSSGHYSPTSEKSLGWQRSICNRTLGLAKYVLYVFGKGRVYRAQHVGWDACEVTCYDLSIFGRLSIDKLLKHIFADSQEYCRNHQLQLHTISLTKDLLRIKCSSAYPTATPVYLQIMVFVLSCSL